MVKIYKDFFCFLINPKYLIDKNNSSNRFIIYLSMFLLMYFSIFIASIFSRFIIYLVDFECGTKIFSNHSANLFKDSLLGNVSYILFILPLIEELIFRLPMSFKKIDISISISLIVLIIFGDGILSLNIISWSFFFKICSLFCFFVFLYNVNTKYLDIIKLRYFSVYFYVLAIFFATMHISNYGSSIPDKYIWFIPFLILPQFIMGVIFGYIRIKFGFFWGVTMHMMTNLPAIILYVIDI